ncbi:MAG: ABC transporter ATP-binding protein [Actinomycetota bacterium]
MPTAAIEVRSLRKTYGELEAVAGVDLDIERGEIYALLGPKGAGKTTTIEILEGYRERTSGDVRVLGHDPGKREQAFRRKIGIVLQETGVEPFLTVEEVIEQYRGYYPQPRPLDEIVEVVGLQEKRRARVTKLSGGQKRRLDVAVGLAGDPELLFLDEPTTGFDPGARRNAWDMVKSLQALDKTVLLTTHYMDEAQHLAGRVGIISAGSIIAEGPPAELMGGGAATTRISFSLDDDASLPDGLARHAVRRDGRIEIATAEPVPLLHELTRWALDGSINLRGLAVARPSLEDVYLELTKSSGGSS